MKNLLSQNWQNLAYALDQRKSNLQKIRLQRSVLINNNIHELAGLAELNHQLVTTTIIINDTINNSPLTNYDIDLGPGPESGLVPMIQEEQILKDSQNQKALPEIPKRTQKIQESFKPCNQLEQQLVQIGKGIGGFQQLFQKYLSKTLVQICREEQSGAIDDQSLKQISIKLKEKGLGSKLNAPYSGIVNNIKLVVRLAQHSRMKCQMLLSKMSQYTESILEQGGVALFETVRKLLLGG